MNVPKLLKQAEKLVSYGKINEAIDIYQDILSEDFQNTTVHSLIAELYISKQEAQRASRHLFKVAADHSSQGNQAAATAAYRKIMKILPRNTLAREKLMEIVSGNGSKTELFTLVSELCTLYEGEENPQKVIEYLEKLVSLDPTNKVHQLRLALFLSERGMKDKAIGLFYQMARDFLREDHFDEALSTLEKIKSIDPKDKEISLRIAQVFEKQGKVQKAIEVILSALGEDSSRTDLFACLAKLYTKAGKIDEAERIHEKLSKQDKNYLREALPFVEVLIADKKINRAVRYVERLYQDIKDNESRKKCIEMLEEILKVDPQSLDAYRLLEACYSSTFQYEQLGITLLSHADAYVAKCDYAHALDLAKQLVDLEPYNEDYRKKFESIEKLSSSGNRAPRSCETASPEQNEEEDETYWNATVDSSFDPQVSIITEEDVDNFILDIELLERFGQQVTAIRRLEQVLKDCPQEIKLRQRLKTLYFERKMPKKAAQECLEIAKLLQQQDEKEEASRYLREALRLNPLLSSARRTPDVGSSPEVQPPQTSGDKEDPAALKGDLSEIGLLDIIQILDNAQKNGKLSINSEGHTGTVFFNSGRIVNAVYEDKVGEPAIFALIAVKGGSFEFKPASFAFDVVINNSNTNLLLEGLRLLDEANRDQWEAEPSLEEDATPPPPSEPTGIQSLETDSGLRPVADITTFPPPPSVDENNPLEDF
jgi:tetratricopeptide (TPR) repeat protein